MGCLAGGAGLKCATGYVLRARLAFMWDEVWVQVGAGGFESRARRRRVYELRVTIYELRVCGFAVLSILINTNYDYDNRKWCDDGGCCR